MSFSRLADFLFVGAGVVPVTLMAGGHSGPALMIMIPLLFIGCLAGMLDFIEDEGSSDDQQ